MKKSLTRNERLSKSKDIEKLFQHGQKVEGEDVRLLFRPNLFAYNRILITVRRGFRTAVGRNRQKRLLKEIYRDQKGLLPQGLDIGFVVKKEVSSFREMQKEFTRLLERARLGSRKIGGPE